MQLHALIWGWCFCLMVVQCVILGDIHGQCWFHFDRLITASFKAHLTSLSWVNYCNRATLSTRCNSRRMKDELQTHITALTTHLKWPASSVLIEDSVQSHNFSIIRTDRHLLPNTITYSLVIHLTLLSKATYCTSIKRHIFAQGHNDGYKPRY